MSQKSTRRARRQTNDEDPAASFKTPKSNDAENSVVEESQPQEITSTQQEVEQNGTEKESSEAENCVVTRSRSTTPQVKKTATQNGHDEEAEKPTDVEESAEVKATEEEQDEELNTSMNKDVEMDPLIVSDEPDPELQFEETSDVESGKSSPIISRCKTRRSQTRNIPTPKTPKLAEEVDGAATSSSSKEDNDLNATFDSCVDDFSTKAEAGGDSTRLEYMDRDVSNLDSNSFLQGTKDKSFGEALRYLSTRRTIRPISEDYRKKLLSKNLNRSADFVRYPSRNSVERVSSVTGLKRKNCTEGEEELRKRFKSESPGFFSRLTSPLSSIRNTFRSEIPSSTPKLTGYKDEKFLLEDDGINSQMCEVSDGERRWCLIM